MSTPDTPTNTSNRSLRAAAERKALAKLVDVQLAEDQRAAEKLAAADLAAENQAAAELRYQELKTQAAELLSERSQAISRQFTQTLESLAEAFRGLDAFALEHDALKNAANALGAKAKSNRDFPSGVHGHVRLQRRPTPILVRRLFNLINAGASSEGTI